MSKLTLSFKGRVLKVFLIQEGEMFIGSDKGCLICVDSLALDAKHAHIVTSNQQSVLYDNNSEQGTFVNQHKITQHKLADGDLIRIGKHTILYDFQELAVEEMMQSSSQDAIKIDEEIMLTAVPAEGHRSAWLQILTGQNLGQAIYLNRPVTNLGKPGVATSVIARRDEGYYISHLEGKYPPKVANKTIGSQSHKLDDGDIIEIGNIKMQFYLE